MLRLSVPVALALVCLGLLPSAAAADGLPVPVDGRDSVGVVAPGGSGPRYATIGDANDTTVLQIDQDGGQITGTRSIRGEYGVPLVALDGTPSGLSADGRTLVLINPRDTFPRRSTSFSIVDIANGRLGKGETLTLRGDYSFDALSPDGDTLFLVEYTSRDYNDYVVREYDLREARLIPEPVLVPDEAPGEMRGLPMTRTTSTDGRWEYTLYDGGGDGEPFIHGLDTVEGTSVCIDLPQLEGEQNILRVGLDLDPGESTIAVTGRDGELLASVDTQTFEVSDPPTAAPATENGDGGAGPVALVAVVVGGLLVGTAAWLLWSRRRSDELPEDPFGVDEPDAEADRDLDRVT